MVLVHPDDPRWHDKSIRPRNFTCDHCGADGHTGEADARFDECGQITRQSRWTFNGVGLFLFCVRVSFRATELLSQRFR